jgi:radical SAM superfamily enzyme YgiQ (UPF0313 family)
MIGFSTTWWPYRVDGMSFSDLPTNTIKQQTHLRAGTLVGDFVAGNSEPWLQVVRDINPKVKFLAGGPKIDFYNDVAFDHIVVGFGETQLVDYLRDTKRIWPKVISHDVNAESNAWSFINSKVQYTQLDQIQPEETLTIEIARGCRFKCSFCSYPLIGRKDVASSSKCEDVLYEELLENYTKWGTTSYFIGDDTFNDSTHKLELLRRVVNKLPFKPSFSAYTRADMIASNLDQVHLLKEIGLRSTFMGIESLHPTASRVIGKGMSEEKRIQALQYAKKVWGDQVYIKAGYIVGLPGESSSFVRSVTEWFISEDSPIDAVNMNPLRILPPGPYPNMTRSDMDKNYSKYGYSFPFPDRMVEWTKDDGTDISSFTQAGQLSNEMNNLLELHRKKIITDDRFGFPDPQKYFKNIIQMMLSAD